jgi:hypothetical protein
MISSLMTDAQRPARRNFSNRRAKRITDFLFAPASDLWLSILRVGLGVQILLYCWSLRSDWQLLFAASGGSLIDRNLAEAILSLESRFAPRLGWLVAIGQSLGLSEQSALLLIWLLLFCASCCLVLGLFSRTAAVTTWFLHLSAAKSGGLFSYGMDNFTTIGLFYLMIAPLPDRFSVDGRFRKLPMKHPQLHGFYRRVLQIHLCIIYFFGGLTKCLGSGWWNGDNLWRALIRPPFNFVPQETLASATWMLPLAGVVVCLLETGYAVFIWPKTTRGYWLGAVIIMHIAIGLTMGLYLFALIMIVLNLSAFGGAWFAAQPARRFRNPR